MEFTDVRAHEILDSRGKPTLAVGVASGARRALASVPSGSSTGRNEAYELRDGDPTRYGGAGVREAPSARRSPPSPPAGRTGTGR